ncbi:DUF2889 domain-containing protein [Paenalcaligenes sp. Me52]|uniref:DUF2889 domain-containing protein n=1 Tax=Paenalcaligenes sp. Me52 TaxID=3392038 RepID=UPI003D2C8CF6
MPLPPSTVSRSLLHTRTYQAQAFEREDGLLDIEAEIMDVKDYDFPSKMSESGVHNAGDPVHHMLMRVTIDKNYVIQDVVATYGAAPYRQHCTGIADAYRQLIGLSLVKGFKRSVREIMSRTSGCTHMTELTDILPTVAIQSMVKEARSTKQAAESNESQQRPFQIDGCHALRSSGEVVKMFYPKWYEAAEHTEVVPE